MKPAIIVTYPNKETMNEAVGLAEAAGYKPLDIVTQRYLQRAKYGLGSGKAEELKERVKTLQAEVILFDERLKTAQAYNLAKLTGIEVIDREKLILEIFGRRATTAEAKLQVQLAELRYEVPRARERVRMAKMGEQPGFFGLGKYEVDAYHMMLKRRMSSLTKKLEEIRTRRKLFRDGRQRLNMPMVSLAGYTGAGKTTFFNLVSGERKEVAGGAFTTLSLTTRGVSIGASRVMLSDTVGFIDRLPTYMIEAFRSTLEELAYADMVLLLLDVSDGAEELRRKFQSCASILTELEVPFSRVTLVFNKVDLVESSSVEDKTKGLEEGFDGTITISAKTGYGVGELKNWIAERTIKYVEMKLKSETAWNNTLTKNIGWLKQYASVSITDSGDEVSLKIRGPSWAIEKFEERCRGSGAASD